MRQCLLGRARLLLIGGHGRIDQVLLRRVRLLLLLQLLLLFFQLQLLLLLLIDCRCGGPDGDATAMLLEVEVVARIVSIADTAPVIPASRGLLMRRLLVGVVLLALGEVVSGTAHHHVLFLVLVVHADEVLPEHARVRADIHCVLVVDLLRRCVAGLAVLGAALHPRESHHL